MWALRQQKTLVTLLPFIPVTFTFSLVGLLKCTYWEYFSVRSSLSETASSTLSVLQSYLDSNENYRKRAALARNALASKPDLTVLEDIKAKIKVARRQVKLEQIKVICNLLSCTTNTWYIFHYPVNNAKLMHLNEWTAFWGYTFGLWSGTPCGGSTGVNPGASWVTEDPIWREQINESIPVMENGNMLVLCSK